MASTVRWTAGVIGGLYLAWGIVYLFASSSLASLAATGAAASLGGLLVLIGALGLAASLVPVASLAMKPERMSA